MDVPTSEKYGEIQLIEADAFIKQYGEYREGGIAWSAIASDRAKAQWVWAKCTRTGISRPSYSIWPL